MNFNQQFIQKLIKPKPFERNHSSISTPNQNPTKLSPIFKSTSTSKPKKPFPIYVKYANNPSELNIRIQQLCKREDGGLDKAIELVKSSSIQVATVSVWTQLFQHLIHAQRFSFVYKLFLEMKRRAIEPDTKYFITFFSALAKCPPSKTITLERLQSIWSQAQSTSRSTLNNALTNAYLHCLINHGHTEIAFELFDKLPPKTIDSITITEILKPLISSNNHEKAKQIWKRVENTLELDLKATISFVTLFHEHDQEFAIKILESKLNINLSTQKYKPWQSALKKSNDQLSFDSGSFCSLLRILLKMRKFSMVCEVWKQVRSDRDLFLKRDSLDFVHCELLIWMIESNNQKLQPTSDTLDKAIQAAWETNQLSSALRFIITFNQISSDQILETQPTLELKTKAPTIKPSIRSFTTLLQTAKNSRTKTGIHQSLILIDRIGCPILKRNEEGLSKLSKLMNGFDAKFQTYWKQQYLWVLSNLLDKQKSEKWIGWRQRIDDYLIESGDFELRTKIETRYMTSTKKKSIR
ncbi:uncharacterized protein MELLADRAFT_111754 [Melampsora larici-populina 98AG31]|uniref:Pentatricopeptide repeat-containing protein n=1 Tax=Melampsora larici-populina (strain 98AG31 / pathotype 3-4-7) TaxID=747676 RepID=F4S443_MELLP|nr:uncharacterized protein MELLADRAFT_111754 [Melampsora larici-populina 98AG31]EGG00573.1 hypothetical protein MELLADRAFT_111754 [Melampsora larici-populina 98AG31]